MTVKFPSRFKLLDLGRCSKTIARLNVTVWTTCFHTVVTEHNFNVKQIVFMDFIT
jgi:hypothetical protein